MVENERLDYMDFVKLCLMFLVVFSHSIVVTNDDWFCFGIQGSSALKFLSTWIGTFHVRAFTVVSGYLYYYLREEKGKYSDIRSFLKKKTRRLVVPCLFILCIWIAPVNGILYHMSAKELVRSFVLMENPSQLWFLLMLFGVFAIARAVGNFPRRKIPAWVCIIMIAYLAGIIGEKVCPNVFQIWNILQYLLFFYLGYYLRLFQKSKDYRLERYWYWFLLGDLLMFVIYKVAAPIGSGMVNLLLRIGMEFVLSFVGCLMAVYCFSRLGKCLTMRGGHLLSLVNYLEKRSMVIYLIHNQFNFLIVHLIYDKFPTGVVVLISFLGTMFLSVIFASLLMHFELTRKLVGE